MSNVKHCKSWGHALAWMTRNNLTTDAIKEQDIGQGTDVLCRGIVVGKLYQFIRDNQLQHIEIHIDPDAYIPTEVIFGQITFEDDGTAIIHRIKGKIMGDNYDDAMSLGEHMVDEGFADAYIIPSRYDKPIIT